MMEHSKKAVIIIVILIFATIISIPVVAYNMKFEVDEKAVEFSVEGIPHCPYCFKIVEPFTGYCLSCERHFRWIDRQVACWQCAGQKTCQVCKGSKYYPFYYLPGQEQCYNCRATGECPFCLTGDLAGYNIFGWSSIRHPEQRK